MSEGGGLNRAPECLRFTTRLANEAARAVGESRYANIMEFHRDESVNSRLFLYLPRTPDGVAGSRPSCSSAIVKNEARSPQQQQQQHPSSLQRSESVPSASLTHAAALRERAKQSPASASVGSPINPASAPPAIPRSPHSSNDFASNDHLAKMMKMNENLPYEPPPTKQMRLDSSATAADSIRQDEDLTPDERRLRQEKLAKLEAVRSIVAPQLCVGPAPGPQPPQGMAFDEMLAMQQQHPPYMHPQFVDGGPSFAARATPPGTAAGQFLQQQPPPGQFIPGGDLPPGCFIEDGYGGLMRFPGGPMPPGFGQRMPPMGQLPPQPMPAPPPTTSRSRSTRGSRSGGGRKGANAAAAAALRQQAPRGGFPQQQQPPMYGVFPGEQIPMQPGFGGPPPNELAFYDERMMVRQGAPGPGPPGEYYARAPPGGFVRGMPPGSLPQQQLQQQQMQQQQLQQQLQQQQMQQQQMQQQQFMMPTGEGPPYQRMMPGVGQPGPPGGYPVGPDGFFVPGPPSAQQKQQFLQGASGAMAQRGGGKMGAGGPPGMQPGMQAGMGQVGEMPPEYAGFAGPAGAGGMGQTVNNTFVNATMTIQLGVNGAAGMPGMTGMTQGHGQQGQQFAVPLNVVSVQQQPQPQQHFTQPQQPPTPEFYAQGPGQGGLGGGQQNPVRMPNLQNLPPQYAEPLRNLDSKLPSQKIQYFPAGGQGGQGAAGERGGGAGGTGQQRPAMTGQPGDVTFSLSMTQDMHLFHQQMAGGGAGEAQQRVYAEAEMARSFAAQQAGVSEMFTATQQMGAEMAGEEVVYTKSYEQFREQLYSSGPGARQ